MKKEYRKILFVICLPVILLMAFMMTMPLQIGVAFYEYYQEAKKMIEEVLNQ